MSNDFVNRFKQSIISHIPSAKVVAGGREIRMPCPFCMEDRGKKEGHLYVKIPIDGQVPLYHCFKCTESGLVNSSFLRKLDIYDVDMITEVKDYTNKMSKSLNFRNLDNEDKIFYLSTNYIADNNLSEIKLKYINKRLGTNLSYNDLKENKIILNLGDLLDHNEITNYTRDINIVRQLNDAFIGFVSADNAFINMRNLTPGKVAQTIDKRYINYNIFGKFSNKHRYYIIPNEIDITRLEPVKIHIAEGPFDILSVYYNLNNGNKDHSIYAAIGGKSYFNIVKYFIEYKGLFNVEFHIYPDADIDNGTIYNISRLLYPLDIKVYMHRNLYQNEKDFGVPLDRIKESIIEC